MTKKPRIAIEADAHTLSAALHDGGLWWHPDCYRSYSGTWKASFHTVRRLINKGLLQRVEHTSQESVMCTAQGYMALQDFMFRRKEGQPCQPKQAA